MIKFPSPEDIFEMKDRGKVYITKLTPEASKALGGESVSVLRDDLKKLIGTTVLLGDHPFLVRAVESYALSRFTLPINLGLLGEYTDTP